MELKSFSEGITTGSEAPENQESNVEAPVSENQGSSIKAFSDDISTGIDIYQLEEIKEVEEQGLDGMRHRKAVVEEAFKKYQNQYPGSPSIFKKNLLDAVASWGAPFLRRTIENWFEKKYNLIKKDDHQLQLLRHRFPEFKSDKVLGVTPPKRISPEEWKKKEETAWKIIRGEVPKYAGVAGIRKWYKSLADAARNELDQENVRNLYPLMMPDEYNSIKEWEDEHIIPDLGGKENIDRIKELWHMFNPTVYPRDYLEMSPQYLTGGR